MKSVHVRWQPGSDRFVADGTHRGHSLTINAPHEGAPTGFSASELLLAGIGSCSAWDVVEILRKGRERVTAVDVTVTGEQAPDPPWPYVRIDIHYTIRGDRLRRAAVMRAVELSCSRYCSVIATVRGVATVTPHVTIVEDAVAARSATG